MDHHNRRGFCRRRGNFTRGAGVGGQNCTINDGREGRGRGGHSSIEDEVRSFLRREEKHGFAEGRDSPIEGFSQDFRRQDGDGDVFPNGRRIEETRGRGNFPNRGNNTRKIDNFSRGRGRARRGIAMEERRGRGQGNFVRRDSCGENVPHFPKEGDFIQDIDKMKESFNQKKSFKPNSPYTTLTDRPFGSQSSLLSFSGLQSSGSFRRDREDEIDVCSGEGEMVNRRGRGNFKRGQKGGEMYHRERKHEFRTDYHSFSEEVVKVEQSFPFKEGSLSTQSGEIQGNLGLYNQNVNINSPPPSLLDLPFGFQPNLPPPTYVDQQAEDFLRRRKVEESNVFTREGEKGQFSRRGRGKFSRGYNEKQARGDVSDHVPIQRRNRRGKQENRNFNPHEKSSSNITPLHFSQNVTEGDSNCHDDVSSHASYNCDADQCSQFPQRNNFENIVKPKKKKKEKKGNLSASSESKVHDYKNDEGHNITSRMYTKNPNLGKSNSSIVSIPINLYDKDDVSNISDVNDHLVHSPDLFVHEESKNSRMKYEEKLEERNTEINAGYHPDVERHVNYNEHNIDRDFSIDDLNGLKKMNPEEIIQILLKDENNFSNIFKENWEPKMFLLVIEILSKICAASPSSERGDILRQASLPMFLDQIFNFVSDFPFTEDKEICDMGSTFFENIVLFYETLLDFMPSAMRIFRTHLLEVDKSIKASIKNLGLNPNPDTINLVKSLLCDTNNIPHEIIKEDNVKQSGKKKDIYFPDPVGDFRTVSLFPRPEDVFSEQPFLYPNIVEGPFASIDQYLDTHFKLLREDFMSPIRQALRDYKKQCNSKDRFKRINNVRIYRKVQFLHPKTIYDKVGYEICFDVDNKLNRVNWEFCSRFLFGSLLLFTNDNFDTFFLATVANRVVKELENKRVTVELQGTLPNAKSILGKVFVMAESEAYFEPYFHVLKALQRFNETNFPLSKYIVDVNSRTDHPIYLTHEDEYNIKTAGRMFSFGVLRDWEWPTHDDLNLDPSQYGAYKAALTNDIVVIQGPPGTGKTFLGLQIAKTLLENSQVWNTSNSPILVVCFTNHALDQFLEGLLRVTNKLVRIGGKSKGRELDKFNIRERRREYNYYKKNQSRITRELNLKMSSVFAEMKVYQNNLQILDDTSGVLSLKTLHLVMPAHQAQYLRDDDFLLDWLLVGIGNKEKKVKITVTADKGVVKETCENNSPLEDYEDQRVKQAFFDAIEFDTTAKPSEDTVKVFVACNIQSIEIRLQEIANELNSKKHRNKNQLLKLNANMSSLDTIIKHLRKGLQESNYFCSELEKDKLLSERNLNSLNPNDRWKLYHIWVNILRNGLITELENKDTEFRKYALDYEQIRQMDDIQILRSSHVVGTTTTLAAKYQPMFEILAPKIVIVEEAAEVLEAHIIASLTKSCQHLILIGDHKQLRPNVAEMRLACQYHLDVSLFERMVINGLACHTLTLQHRMRPEISQQLVPTIYPSLKDHESVKEREPIRGMDKNVFFMTHKHFEDEVVEITSKRNQFEAGIALRLARYLVMQGYSPQEITILATYKGQMYHMKNEIKNIADFPKGIQITVVDNFQGEENRIIILSLVRSNAINKIGFLSIENRVCVALSRARDGLYVIGNMDNMVASSDIWPHIKNSFLRQGAFGSALRLRCQIHREQVTSITCIEDFRKVSEGGCSLICGQELPCNHICKSMCHLKQEYHQHYKCREPCPKILCQEGHQCPSKCFMKCGECQVPIQRDLPCGHQANVPCYLEMRYYQCKEMVKVNVPLCGHSVMVECHASEDPECNKPCDYRLDCGHSCDRTCHADDDPEHTQYICTKPCPELNKDCSEDHKCQLLCCRTCKKCSVLVKKCLPCGHSVKTVCSSDLSSIQCRRDCERTRPCGHPCTKKCWEPCYPCPVEVEKLVPACGHAVQVACSATPTKAMCSGACTVKLACGDQCTLRCKDPCSIDNCKVPKTLRMTFTRMPCGHKKVIVPCNKTSLVKSLPVEEQMEYCAELCNQQLACTHTCSGTCGGCMQARIHQVCDQPCGNVLICGHSCKDPCREVCPPCDRPCMHECKHSKCPRKCGQPCIPCKEPCDYQCPHLKCNRLCGELCDRNPCYENCPKQLDCTHPCVGFCGEPCPPCRQCEPQHFEEFFKTGEETEDDAKWIYLEDCKHTFEYSGLEYWLNMKHEDREIVAKMCPGCKTPIVKVQRFMNLIKHTYFDIQQIKERCFGRIDEIRKQRNQALKKLQEINFVSMRPPSNGPDELEELYMALKDELPEVNRMRRKVVDAKKSDLLCFETEFFISLYQRKLSSWDTFNGESKDIVTKKINVLTSLLKQRDKKISEQEMKSFQLELKRIHRMFDLLHYTNSYDYRMIQSQSAVNHVKKQAETLIFSITIYDEALDKLVVVLLSQLKKLIGSATEISSAERAMIHSAMSGSFHSQQKTGHWFKCKNGHIYCITECGGAMERRKCPITGCGELIGGENHSLLQDQAVASEMDGAKYAAWSDQNNMANFGFIH